MRATSHFVGATGIALLLISTLLWIVTSHVSADTLTFTVTKTEDTADGTCDADCSLREAIMAANASALPATVIVNAGTYALTLGNVDDANASGDLDIHRSMSIHGAGSADVIVDAGGLIALPERVMQINPAATEVITVSVAGLTIRNGKQLSADFNEGGGMWARNARLTLTDVVFLSNTVKLASAVVPGGALYLLDSEATVSDCHFVNNSANYGGAIYLLNSAMSMSNSVVHGNQATESGGGIQAFGQGIMGRIPVNVSIFDSTVSSNTVTSAWHAVGGGIKVEGWSEMGDALHIVRSTIAGNRAILVPGGRYKSKGGGIYLYETSLKLHNSTVSSNAAVGAPGQFEHEESMGGGLYVANVSSTPAIVIAASQILSNEAESAGGIWVAAEQFTMTESTVAFNHATGTTYVDSGRGGGIYIEYDGANGVQRLQTVRIYANDATGSGGGIFVNGMQVTLDDSEVDYNRSGAQGGGYYGGGVIKSSRIHHNSAKQGGGISTVRVVTVVSSTIEFNQAIDADAPMGGGIFTGGVNSIYQQLTILGSTIHSNLAQLAPGGTGLSKGGGIYSRGDNSYIAHSAITSNQAQSGGGIWRVPDEGGIVDTVIAENRAISGSVTAAGWGGGIYIGEGWRRPTCDLLRVALSGNQAAHSGGGLAGAGEICSSMIQHNEAAGDGGGMVITNGTKIVSSTLHHNIAGNHGGGVVLVQTEQTRWPMRFEVVNSTLSGNRAQYGGAFSDGKMQSLYANSYITDSTIAGNTASVAGDGLFHGGNGYTCYRNPDLTYHCNYQTCDVTGVLLSDNGSANCDGRIFDDLVITIGNPPVTLRYKTFHSAGFNLSSDARCDLPSSGDVVATPAQIGALQDNGGNTWTHALLPASPAIDANRSDAMTGTDQRGMPRPQGTRADIGAFEFSFSSPLLRVSPSALSFTCVANAVPPAAQTVQVENAGAGELNWQIDAPVPWLQLTPTTGMAPATVSATIAGCAFAPGSYAGTFTVAESGGMAQKSVVSVTLTVLDSTNWTEHLYFPRINR
jgi:CSLREA domain-containing protein